MNSWDGYKLRGLMGCIPLFEHRVASFPGTSALLEWWQRLVSHRDTLVLHGMAAMVPAMRCLCVMKSGLKVDDRRQLVFSRDVLVEEVKVRLFRPSRVFCEKRRQSCFKRIFYFIKIEFFII